MVKWKRNQIFETIQGTGLDPNDFDLKEGNDELRIKHKWSDSYFIIRGTPAQYTGSYVVGDGPTWPYDAYSWEAIIPRVSSWLEEVKRDLETPDLWTDLQREADLLGGASDEANENTPFTPEEQKEIVERLQKLAEYAMSKYSLSGPQIEILHTKIDYLVAAAGRLGRTDWRGVFAGAILGFVLSAAFPPESARQILMALLRAIGHFYGRPELPGG